MVRKIPTPTATVIISVQLLMASDTYPARICRSGSAMVTIMPMTNDTRAISHILREWVTTEPIFSPMTSIDISAPILKPESPITSKNAPIKNSTKGYVSTPSMTARTSIITAIGNIEDTDSLSFSKNAVFIHSPYKQGLNAQNKYARLYSAGKRNYPVYCSIKHSICQIAIFCNLNKATRFFAA